MEKKTFSLSQIQLRDASTTVQNKNNNNLLVLKIWQKVIEGKQNMYYLYENQVPLALK